MKYKKTDLDIKKKITLETFKSYLEIYVKDISENRWNHLKNIVDDLEEILDYGVYGPFPKDLYEMKMVYETLLNKIKDKTVFDDRGLEFWETYYLNKNRPNGNNKEPLNSRKIKMFINNTFKKKISGYIND